jgi:hypothetical protein
VLASSVRPSRRPDSKFPWRKISVAGQAKSNFLLPFLVGPVLKRMRQARSFVG